MKLTRVTITGADDGVDPDALLDLSEEFPFVEWAVLISTQSKPRYPTEAWIRSFGEAQQRRAPIWYPWAVHLCGATSRRAMGGCDGVIDLLLSVSGDFRVQINGFSKYRLPLLLIAERLPRTEFVLQCSSGEALAHAVEQRERHPNVVALWDPSGGLGQSFVESGAWFPRAQNFAIPIGYAGGITEDNIEDTIAMLCSGIGDPLWVDLESGARIDDKFDLAKVRRILELAAPFVRVT